METHCKPAESHPFEAIAILDVRRLRQKADFELLKSRMLIRAMNETPGMELHIFIFRAAVAAADLAWQTPFPLLVFPGLFEEMLRENLSAGR